MYIYGVYNYCQIYHNGLVQFCCASEFLRSHSPKFRGPFILISGNNLLLLEPSTVYI